MSSTEKRAWLTVWSMLPAYAVYFVLQSVAVELFPSFLARIGVLTITASVHALIYVTGLCIVKRQERGESLLQDERDRGIDARATRVAYFIMMTGMCLVGVAMPFSETPWKIANTGLFFIVLAEACRAFLMIRGYRGGNRLAF